MYARNLLEKSSLLTRVVTQGTDDMAERPHFICRPREAQQALVQDAKAFSFPQDSDHIKQSSSDRYQYMHDNWTTDGKNCHKASRGTVCCTWTHRLTERCRR